MMRLLDLTVIHALKGEGETLSSIPTFARALEIDSCLRRVWVLEASPEEEITVPEGCELYTGTDAYAFLLRLSCGLESRIAGETDIFGQVKEAWQQFSSEDTELAPELAPWIQKLFEDVKEVRSLYLRSVGGGSYGSLVRKLVGGELEGTTLLIGAGRLAQSIAPFLAGGRGELLIWNRTAERAEALASHCRLDKKASTGAKMATVQVLSGDAELEQALRRATRAVVCVPFDAETDAKRIQIWKESGADRRLVHLGGLSSQAGEWVSLEGYVGLDQLFDLARAQDGFRDAQVKRARKACDEKAKLRSLGGSSATQHGWEDLAIFAGV